MALGKNRSFLIDRSLGKVKRLFFSLLKEIYYVSSE
jgi:hypothetical protein